MIGLTLTRPTAPPGSTALIGDPTTAGWIGVTAGSVTGPAVAGSVGVADGGVVGSVARGSVEESEGGVTRDDVTLRGAVEADLPGLLGLEGTLEPPWSAAAWREELDRDGHAVLVAEPAVASGGLESPNTTPGLIGAVAISWCDDVADLLRLLVAPAWRRRGWGRRLVDAAVAHLRPHGVERFLLEVSAGNAPALALYRAEGWSAIGRRRDYYGPGDDAIVMARRLAGDAGRSAAVGGQP